MAQKLMKRGFRSSAQPLGLLTAALEEIVRRSMPKRDVTEAIHSVRVGCKRLRALLELLRPYISDSEYRDQKQRIKAAVRELATIRDSQVLRETLESAAGWFSKRKRDKYCRWIASIFPTRTELLDRQACRRSKLRLRKASAELPPPDHSPTDLRKFSVSGLRNSYRRARGRMLKCRKSPKAEFLHRWRKAAKCLFSQLELLETAGLPIECRCYKSLGALQRDLGKYRDLLLAESFHPAGEHVPKALRKAIRQRRKHLQSDLLRRGKRIFSRSDDDFLASAIRTADRAKSSNR